MVEQNSGQLPIDTKLNHQYDQVLAGYPIYPHIEAFKRLRIFLDGGLPYSEMVAFRLSTIFTHRLFSLSKDLLNLIRKGENIFGIPKQDEYNLYKWVDFYLGDASGRFEETQIVDSYRVDEKNKKIENKNWFGPDIQMFIDYLTGENNINFSQLKPFTKKLSKRGYFAKVAGKNINLILNKPQNLNGHQSYEVNFYPKRDEERGYVWLEGYLSRDLNSQAMVCSYRIYPGESKLHQWKGPETQSLIDWINNALTFELAQQVTTGFRQSRDRNTIFIEQSEKNKIVIDLSSRRDLNKEDKFVLIPRKDELYEWVEVYKLGLPDSKPTFITYARVNRETRSKLDSLWVGPTRQRYQDYIEGKIGIRDLQSYGITVPLNGDIYLFTDKKNDRSISAYLPSDIFSAGDEVTINLTENNDNKLIIEFRNESDPKKQIRYLYDRQNGSFLKISEDGQVIKNSPGHWSPERVRSEATILIGKHKLTKITYEVFSELGKSDLAHGISNHYPGGIIQLSIDLGITPHRKPQGYWSNTENIEKEALFFYQTEGDLSYGLLLKRTGASTLRNAIQQYPGKIDGLRKKLGILGEKPDTSISSEDVDQWLDDMLKQS
ncbi:hypothetical protein HYT02_01365 [Candidatus Gottesmanbacteria bacterium]|nr:hypothetical protein [Candidatus Gottesmanbacteria bacterium]